MAVIRGSRITAEQLETLVESANSLQIFGKPFEYTGGGMEAAAQILPGLRSRIISGYTDANNQDYPALAQITFDGGAVSNNAHVYIKGRAETHVAGTAGVEWDGEIGLTVDPLQHSTFDYLCINATTEVRARFPAFDHPFGAGDSESGGAKSEIFFSCEGLSPTLTGTWGWNFYDHRSFPDTPSREASPPDPELVTNHPEFFTNRQVVLTGATTGLGQWRVTYDLTGGLSGSTLLEASLKLSGQFDFSILADGTYERGGNGRPILDVFFSGATDIPIFRQVGPGFSVPLPNVENFFAIEKNLFDGQWQFQKFAVVGLLPVTGDKAGAFRFKELMTTVAYETVPTNFNQNTASESPVFAPTAGKTSGQNGDTDYDYDEAVVRSAMVHRVGFRRDTQSDHAANVGVDYCRLEHVVVNRLPKLSGRYHVQDPGANPLNVDIGCMRGSDFITLLTLQIPAGEFGKKFYIDDPIYFHGPAEIVYRSAERVDIQAMLTEPVGYASRFASVLHPEPLFAAKYNELETMLALIPGDGS